MKQLLYKEYKLCLVSMVPIFYLFALMLLIPNYPYLVAAFFTCNSVFFLFKQSVVNGDLLFTTLLPVAKGDVVRARVRFVVIIQMIMFLLFIPLCYANHLLVPRNPAGTDGSLTFLAAALVLFTIFNGTFLPGFYRNEHKMDKLFLISLIAVFGWIILWEGCMITAGAAERPCCSSSLNLFSNKASRALRASTLPSSTGWAIRTSTVSRSIRGDGK